MEKETKIREQFDRAAAAYGESPIFAKGHDLALMVKAASPTPEMTVLDIGCAAGHTAFAFAPQVREVVGVDLSPGMLTEAAQQAATRNLGNVRFQEAIATQLPFANGQFDLVTCRYAAHHFPSLRPMLAEVVRVLKAGGEFLVVDIISPEDAGLAEFINRVEVLRDPSHSRDWMLSEWQTAFTEVGMSCSVVAEWRLPIDFADWTARQQTPPAAMAELELWLDGASAAERSAFGIMGPPVRSLQLWSVLLQAKKLVNGD